MAHKSTFRLQVENIAKRAGVVFSGTAYIDLTNGKSKNQPAHYRLKLLTTSDVPEKVLAQIKQLPQVYKVTYVPPQYHVSLYGQLRVYTIGKPSVIK